MNHPLIGADLIIDNFYPRASRTPMVIGSCYAPSGPKFEEVKYLNNLNVNL
jgi:hypothetical protein